MAATLGIASPFDSAYTSNQIMHNLDERSVSFGIVLYYYSRQILHCNSLILKNVVYLSG